MFFCSAFGQFSEAMRRDIRALDLLEFLESRRPKVDPESRMRSVKTTSVLNKIRTKLRCLRLMLDNSSDNTSDMHHQHSGHRERSATFDLNTGRPSHRRSQN